MNSLDNTSSSYWKVPDETQYLTAVATHETDPLIAVASGSHDSNLFIYEFKDGGDPITGRGNVLTHHQTITLSGIHSLAWVSPRHPLGSQGNVLASGHNSGIAHFILLPDPYSNNVPAEIVRRFNHNRHLPKSSSSTRIKHLQLSSDSWSCCPPSSLITLCSESLFLWDPSRSDVPMLRKKCKGSACFHASELRNGIVGMGGSKGISIKDIRSPSSGGLSPPTDNTGLVSTIQWSPTDDNLLAAVHDSTSIKVWDIRNHAPLVTFDGHTDLINCIKWNTGANNSGSELYSASNDGTIRVWSASSCENNKISPLAAAASEPLDTSVSGSPKELDWIQNKPWKLYRQRLSRYDDDSTISQYFIDRCQQATRSTIFSGSKQYFKLAAIQTQGSPIPSLISVDSEGYFGLHTKDVFSFELDSSSSTDQHSSEEDYSPPSRSSLSSPTTRSMPRSPTSSISSADSL